MVPYLAGGFKDFLFSPQIIGSFLGFGFFLGKKNYLVDFYPLWFGKLVAVCDPSPLGQKYKMKAILANLKKQGTALATGYCYTGVNPLAIRNRCKAAGEASEISYLADSLIYAAASALYGTVCAT